MDFPSFPRSGNYAKQETMSRSSEIHTSGRTPQETEGGQDVMSFRMKRQNASDQNTVA
jgi:hypothetical protein